MDVDKPNTNKTDTKSTNNDDTKKTTPIKTNIGLWTGGFC